MKEDAMRTIVLALLIAALAAGGAACSGGDDESADDGEATVAATAEGAATEAAMDEAAGDAVAVSEPARGGGSLPAAGGPRVIQTASLTISVPRDDFQETVDRARTITAGLGGFVVGSSASQGEERRLVRGSLVVRVPERSYAQAMERLGALGRVEAQEEDGQDVSQELVDLEARARHLEAVEAQLLGLLERADTVPAALTVQGELNRVQLELEQARGRLRSLEDSVAYATITLAIHEGPAAAPVADAGGWGIVDAWRTAAHGFVTVVGWMLIAAATAAPFLLLLALVLLAARVAARRGVLRRSERPSA